MISTRYHKFREYLGECLTMQFWMDLIFKIDSVKIKFEIKRHIDKVI